MTIEPGQTLSHYRLVEKIGEGGMGVVWKAEDTVLGRIVAIKVLPAHVARDSRRRKMFLDEARLASSVSEAHIVQVYDFAQEDDLEFIVMEYVDGTPLSRVLKERSLSHERVAEIGHQVARALSRAHRKGLIHRDLKPSNILITQDDEAKVVDFGLATLFTPQESTIETTGVDVSKATTISEANRAEEKRVVSGTLPYMSPEQVRGEDLDARSDVFSLGSVLYEMTTGRRPFTGATFEEVARRIQEALPRDVHELAPDVPHDLAWCIGKALSSHRGDRYQTMDDMAVDLRRIRRGLESGSTPSYTSLKTARSRSIRTWAILGASVVLTVFAATWFLGPGPRDQTASRTLLVLPFEVQGQTEEPEYMGRTFADALTVNLAGHEDLHVLPVPQEGELGTAGALDRAEVASGLGAGRMLTGTLTRTGDSILASANIVDTRVNRILWGTQMVDDSRNLSALAVSLARQVSAELAATRTELYEYWFNVTGSPEMAASPEWTEALAAVRRFEVEAGLETTERLIRKFPLEPDAHVLRVRALTHAGGTPLFSEEQFKESIEVLERLDPLNATAATFRCLLLTSSGSSEQVADCVGHQLARGDLSPAQRGWLLRIRAGRRALSGDMADALSDIEKATSLDPANHYNHYLMGRYWEIAGDLDAAMVSLRKSVALAPAEREARAGLARVLESRQKWHEAAAAWGELCAARSNAEMCASHSLALLKAGERAAALEAAERTAALLDLPNQDEAHGAYSLACVWALAGESEPALRLLRRSVEAEPRDPDAILADEDLISLHSDPEFEAIIAETARLFHAKKQ